MREMQWSWDQLQATPVDVRIYAWDCIRMERAAVAERAERAAKAKDGQSGVTRVEW